MKVDALMMAHRRAQNAHIQTVLDGFFGQLPGAAFLQGDLDARVALAIGTDDLRDQRVSSCRAGEADDQRTFDAIGGSRCLARTLLDTSQNGSGFFKKKPRRQRSDQHLADGV